MIEMVDRDAEGATTFNRLLGEMRPKLHRYCARMTGSAIDAEDVVQEALVKAIEAYPGSSGVSNPEGWLFRIAHNAALDFLRARARRQALRADEEIETMPDPKIETEGRAITSASLRTFMRLPVVQRSSVILMDVLGYSIQEITTIIDGTVPAVKAALHRGRARLHELAQEPDDKPVPKMADSERARLAAYVERFNARDFDTLRDMLAEDVRLELVNHHRLNGRKEVGNYFGNYSKIHDWQLVTGLVDGRPAILVYDPDDALTRPRYFVILEWANDRVVAVRDFRFARYAIESADLVALP